MSMRSDYELSVSTVDKSKIDKQVLVDWLDKLPWDIAFRDSDADEGKDPETDVCRMNPGDDGFYLQISECHPDEVDVPDLSLDMPGVRLYVDEYIHEATEMVEAGRDRFLLCSGFSRTLESVAAEAITSLRGDDKARSCCIAAELELLLKGPR
jgi:hypothetical protein